MAIAKRLEWYLEAAGIDYEVLPHPRLTLQCANSAPLPSSALLPGETGAARGRVSAM